MSDGVVLRSGKGGPSLRLRSGLPVSIIAPRSWAALPFPRGKAPNRSVQIANPQTAPAPGVSSHVEQSVNPGKLLTVGGKHALLKAHLQCFPSLASWKSSSNAFSAFSFPLLKAALTPATISVAMKG